MKILDFGLARFTCEEKVDLGLTSEGQAIGTPDYIAPEQILDATSADTRADIYSLGGTLYHLLLGRPPFQAGSLYDMYQAHLSREAEPLNYVRSEVPDELASVVAKMMAKEPSRRFQTPADVAAALTPFFQKGNARSQRLEPEISRASAAAPQTSSARPGSLRSSPATKTRSVGPPPLLSTSSRSQPPPLRKSMLAAAPPPLSAPRAPGTASRRTRWLQPKAIAGAAAAVVVGWLRGVLSLNTDHGVIELDNLPKHAEVFIDGRRVTVEWPAVGGPPQITVPAGERRVEVKVDGVEMKFETVTVKTSERRRISVPVSF